jgi:hypothetical protein
VITLVNTLYGLWLASWSIAWSPGPRELRVAHETVSCEPDLARGRVVHTHSGLLDLDVPSSAVDPHVALAKSMPVPEARQKRASGSEPVRAAPLSDDAAFWRPPSGTGAS